MTPKPKELIPALFGPNLTDVPRNWMSLPVRHGGMGIIDPVKIANDEYTASREISASLIDSMIKQDGDYMEDMEESKKIGREIRRERDVNFIERADKIERGLEVFMKQARWKTGFTWLSMVPTDDSGIHMSNHELSDHVGPFREDGA